MANYYCKTRTNYFSVTDVEKFKEIINSCGGSDTVEIMEDDQSDGSVKYGFYCEGSIDGLPERENDDGSSEDSDDVDYNFDAFCEALQKILPDGDAIIITEVGSEKMRYLTAYSIIITSSEVKSIDLGREAAKLAAGMLQNPEFTTKMEY